MSPINAFGLMQAADKQGTGLVDEFALATEKARKQDEKSVRTTIEPMGKTGPADTKFEAEGPGWKDMMRLFPVVPRGNN